MVLCVVFYLFNIVGTRICKKGDEVQVELVGNQVIIKKVPQMVELPDGIPADFFTLLEEEMEAHHEALKGLVDR